MDRNQDPLVGLRVGVESPSSRRAWIEIIQYFAACSAPMVALLAEGVDRNFVPCRLLWEHWEVALLAEGVDRNPESKEFKEGGKPSPSSRRAWIEILVELGEFDTETVALLAEGVDRNFKVHCFTSFLLCRPPRGGRG